jgi:hypothetical protein
MQQATKSAACRCTYSSLASRSSQANRSHLANLNSNLSRMTGRPWLGSRACRCGRCSYRQDRHVCQTFDILKQGLRCTYDTLIVGVAHHSSAIRCTSDHPHIIHTGYVVQLPA